MAYVTQSPLQPLRKIPLNPGPSIPQLLIRNLKFLNFDLLDDWPRIGNHAFSAKLGRFDSQKERIQRAEWILFRLFEIWDPKTTKERLKAFFPPLEPRQSIGLRAAFFQLLSELKANGTLSRDVSIRRTTLDECRGERFEELLFAFSTLVLRKTVERVKPQLPLAQQIAIRRSPAGPDDLSPLLWAHEASLRHTQQERENFRSRAKGMNNMLTAKADEFDKQADAARSRFDSTKTVLEERSVNLSNLKSQLRDDHTGDPYWLSLAISGDANTDRNLFLEKSFEDVWSHPIAEEQPDVHFSNGWLQGLTIRVQTQNDRLKIWRAFQLELSRRNEHLASQSPKTPRKTPGRTPARNGEESPKKSPIRRRFPKVRSASPNKSMIGEGLSPSPIKRLQCPEMAFDETLSESTRLQSKALQGAVTQEISSPLPPPDVQISGTPDLPSFSPPDNEQIPEPVKETSPPAQEASLSPPEPTKQEVRTPPETLFAEEVEMSSVFKTRSKLRFSPPTSVQGDSPFSSPQRGERREDDESGFW